MSVSLCVRVCWGETSMIFSIIGPVFCRDWSNNSHSKFVFAVTPLPENLSEDMTSMCYNF